MFALLALEKFAQTRENQITICKLFAEHQNHPLLKMEEYLKNEPVSRLWHAKQEGFCAQWALDNIFILESRPYSYETCETSQINAMLNHEDVSEYLKIGPDGLEARCDVSSFESVRCTFEVMDGCWYYEATVLTSGVMQIGLATKRSRFLNHEGYGIGDDASSVAYDGCRQLVWHNAKSLKHEHDNWQPGDVVGILLDIPNGEVIFSLNGTRLKEANSEFLSNRQPSEGVFAAASFMSFQQCRFNFGATRFKHNPGRAFRCFNDFGNLTTAQRTIVPRRLRLEQLEKEHIPDDYCTICFAAPATTALSPCNHDGFCSDCCNMMDHCPLCRGVIEERYSQINNNKFLETVKSPSNSSVSGLVRINSQRKSIRAASAIAASTGSQIQNGANREISRRHTQV
uniref:RING-type E3 ubiquitin transferase n=1 Tax=Caenorhabditis japonica TaxID=281687 RepID=A0A8R1HJ72_CAEJA